MTSAGEPVAPVGAVAAIDVGGTTIKYGLLDRSGTVLKQDRRPTGVRHGADAVVAGIIELAAELAAEPGVAAIGIGVPGLVDSTAGIARYSANIGWRDIALTELITQRTGLPTALGHDVRLGALAEALVGAGRGATAPYFLAIGTGIAGGQVTDGRIGDGGSGQTGEIGHLVVRRRGPRCQCGGRGCLETIASASRIAAHYRRRARRRGSASDVAARVAEGDPIALAVWAEAVSALADALVAQIVLADPDRIVIGGGLSLAGDTLLAPLRPAVAARLTFRSAPEIVVGELGDRAGMVGAALRGWDLVDGGHR